MRILIVEDEKMAAVLKKGLGAENHRVTLAFDGRTELELGSTDFDVIVLDLMLPLIGGFEVARRLREKWEPDADPDAHGTGRSPGHR